MRPHRLRVTAFGPFADTVEVDLDALAASGLFLLQGETGAGKTTLLDALGFALYGSVPGARNKAGRLRSDVAAPDVRTAVQLEVTLAGRRLRVTRSPEQERPKKRGDGFTKEQASVLLEEQVAGDWHPVSSRVGEADAELLDLLGMSASQFFQVVLLPQGEFAKFLRSEAKDKGELLQALFGTQRFSQVESWLAERRRAAAAEAAAAGEAVRQAEALVRQAAGLPLDGDDLLDPPGLTAAAASAASAATAAATAAEQQRDAVRAVLQEARSLAEAQQRRAAALVRQARVAEQEPDLARARAELEAATRAAPVRPVLAQAQLRDEQQAAARKAVEAALDALGSRETWAQERTVQELWAQERTAQEPLAQELSAQELSARAEQVNRRQGRLEQLREVADAREAELATVAEARAESASAGRRTAELAELLAGLPERRAAASAALAVARAAEVRLPAVRAETALLRTVVADATALRTADAQAAGLVAELGPARETSLTLRERALQVREDRVNAMIYELASTLVDGDECPVCGSFDHPAPSEVPGERATREDEEAAARLADDARREVEELTGRLAAAEATAGQLRERLGEQAARSVEELRAELVASGEREAGLEADAARAGLLADALERVDEEQAEAETERAALVAARQAADRRAQEAEQRAERTRAQLEVELAGAPDLGSALAAAAAEAADLEAARLALEALERAVLEQDAAAQALRDAAAAAGFDDLEDAVAGVRAPARVAAVQAALREADDERAAVAALLADPALAVPLDPPADVAGALRQLSEADASVDLAVAVRTSAAERAAELAVLVPALDRAVAARAPLQARADQVRHLADLVAGGGANAFKMTLSSYVLAARLEEVAEAASARLLRMSQGRYSLVHTDDVRGGGRSGLGLLARDTWTGRDRDTATLSGGETFLASLALALGLADVVTAEAGGARIEALFVDEGFGTLDEQTLDEVMDVLDGLREGGRVVGLVSHVAELRQRIPAQLRVHKDRRGSTISLVGC